MGKERRQKLLEQEMPGTGGGEFREKKLMPFTAMIQWGVEIKAFASNVAFIRVAKGDVPSDELCINGRCVCTAKRNPLKEGHTKTET